MANDFVVTDETDGLWLGDRELGIGNYKLADRQDARPTASEHPLHPLPNPLLTMAIS